MQSHLEQQPKIADIVDFLGGLRIFSNAESKAVDQAVSAAIIRATGPLIPINQAVNAKL
jgi:hypothetical protein